MPVEIVLTSTNPLSGQINATDLSNMKDDFINESDVKPCNGRTRLIKKFSVSLMKTELKDLIAYYESLGNIDVIKINFALHISPFTACNGGDFSDSLTSVIETARFIDSNYPELGHISNSGIGDFVVIPGYGGINKNGWHAIPPCCPSSNP